MVRCAVLVAAVGLLLAGCGGGSSAPTPREQRFSDEMADVALAVSGPISALDGCTDRACLERRGPGAEKVIAAQDARVERSLRGAGGKCFAGPGRSFLGALRAYESAAQQAGRGLQAASRATETRAGALASGSVGDFTKCAHTKPDTTPLSHALLLVQHEITRIDKCGNGLTCLDQEGAALTRLAVGQQRVLDASLARKGKCAAPARRSVDRGFAALRRMGQAVRILDENSANTRRPARRTSSTRRGGRCGTARAEGVDSARSRSSYSRKRRKESTVQYLLLIYDNEAMWSKQSDEDRGQIMQEYMAFTTELRESGKFVGGDALQPTSTAKTVSAAGVTDGPFAETKEQLGGYYLIDVESADEALEWAAKIPSARLGSIEVRPVMVFDREEATA